MSHEHELDERLRQRVASLYERDASPAVDTTARARALGEAWRAQRRVRRRRAQVVALSCGLMAAAAGVLLMLRGAGRLQPLAAGSAAQPLAAGSAAQPLAAGSAAQPLAAGGCRLPVAPAWSVAASGQRVLALGELGRLVGDAKLLASSACELRVEVADGTLAGQLHALRPSRIVIATAGGSVIVTGTRFSVRAREDELRVVLAAGTVHVEEPGGAAQELSAGHVLSRRAHGEASILPLSAAEAARLDQLLGVAKDDERAVLTSAVDGEGAVAAGAAVEQVEAAANGGPASARRSSDPARAAVERSAARPGSSAAIGGEDSARAGGDRGATRPGSSAAIGGEDSARAGGDRGAARPGISAAIGGEDSARASRHVAARDGAEIEDARRTGGAVRSIGATRAAERALEDRRAAARNDAESARGSVRAAAATPAVEAVAHAANPRAAEDASGFSFTCDARRDGAADSGELLAEGELARRKGRLALARRCYAAAADGGNADAEVALLRWVRLELDHEAPDRASALLARHAREFARPTLAAEAAWLGVQVLAARGDSDSARAAAEELIRAHATTPQARAARAWLRQQ